MKKFIIKNILFLSPLLLVFISTIIFYNTDKGDLLKIGYIIDYQEYNSRNVFKKDYELKIKYSTISEINLQSVNKFNVLIIGDSFSQQSNFGYKNQLSNMPNITVLNFNNDLYYSALQTLYSLTNSNVLDNIKVDYIILQSVERHFIELSENLDTNKTINNELLQKLIKEQKIKDVKADSIKKSSVELLFSDRMKKFLTYNINYLKDDNAFTSETYKVATTQQLFSIKKNQLLFYYYDYEIACKKNNTLEAVKKLNATLNKISLLLAKRGIKLIVLPSPDKYDIYYEYIVEKSKYTKPIFFDNLSKLPKQYIYVDSKKILSDAIKTTKDIYFYDDSHWSPIASKLIAKELYKKMNIK